MAGSGIRSAAPHKTKLGREEGLCFHKRGALKSARPFLARLHRRLASSLADFTSSSPFSFSLALLTFSGVRQRFVAKAFSERFAAIRSLS